MQGKNSHPPCLPLQTKERPPMFVVVVSRAHLPVLHVAGEPLALCVSGVLNAGGTGAALGPTHRREALRGCPPLAQVTVPVRGDCRMPSGDRWPERTVPGSEGVSVGGRCSPDGGGGAALRRGFPGWRRTLQPDRTSTTPPLFLQERGSDARRKVALIPRCPKEDGGAGVGG